VNAFLNRWKG